MARYDYQYQRRIQQGRPQPPRKRFRHISNRALHSLILATLIGFAIGLFYAWQIEPVVFRNHTPRDLEGNHYSEYVLLIAQTFSVEKDIVLARVRLETLASDNPAGIVVDHTERMILTGANHSDIQVMLALADALGVTSPSLESYGS